MENASKALIIAGAILLAILIISLGIMIYNRAAGVVNNSSVDEVEVSSFNQKFQQYEGTNIRGAQVNALIQQIASSNVTNQSDSSRQVALKVTANNWQGSNKPNGDVILNTSDAGKAQSGRTYDVTTETDSKTGFINTITISDHN